MNRNPLPDHYCYPTWDGVTIAAPEGGEERAKGQRINNYEQEIKYFTDLETRIQIPWLIAYYAQRWSGKLFTGPSRTQPVERLRVVDDICSARCTSDHRGHLTKGQLEMVTSLLDTSKLSRQINDARRAFEDTEKYLEYRERVRVKASDHFLTATRCFS